MDRDLLAVGMPPKRWDVVKEEEQPHTAVTDPHTFLGEQWEKKIK